MMTDEPKKPSSSDDKDLPETIVLVDPFDVAVSAVPDDDIPVIPVVKRAPVPMPDDLPEAVAVVEKLPSRFPPREPLSNPRPNIDPSYYNKADGTESPQPKVFFALFIMFLVVASAAIALSVLIYSLYFGFQTLKPNLPKKKEKVTQVEPFAPAITTA